MQPGCAQGVPSGTLEEMTCWTAGGRPLPSSSPSSPPTDAWTDTPLWTPLWMPPSPGVPQTSQYPSTMVPEHPGCWQAPVAAAEPDSAATLPGIPQTSQ